MESNQLKQAYQSALFPFDPVIPLLDVLRKWALILVAALLCGMGACVYTEMSHVPCYRSETTVAVMTRDGVASDWSELNSNAALATGFAEILNSQVMRNNALDELGMDSFNGTIEAVVLASSNLVSVQVTARDPRTAYRVIEVLTGKHETVTGSVMGEIALEGLEPAVVPTVPCNPVSPRSIFWNTSAAAAAALFLQMVFLSWFKDVVRSRDEAERKLGCRCLGEIRHEPRDGILITNSGAGSRYGNTMSKLRRRVEQGMPDGGIVMVTSVMKAEGKTTVSANLALAMAKKYEEVLLIDLNLHRPACRRIMGHGAPEYDACDVIRGKVSLGEAVKTDRVSGLTVLFAEQCDPGAAVERIHSPGLEAMLRQAREMYRYVVVDLPPMTGGSGAESVMEFADGILLVIQQNHVRVEALNRAIRNLRRGKAKLLGCVLNKVYTSAVTEFGVRRRLWKRQN